MDLERRDRASRLLLDRLRDPKLSLQRQNEVGLIALELASGAEPRFDESANVFTQALTADPSESLKAAWKKHLFHGSARLEPTLLAQRLAAAIENDTDVKSISEGATAFASCAAQLDKSYAARLCASVARAIASRLGTEPHDISSVAFQPPVGPHYNLANTLVSLSQCLKSPEVNELFKGALTKEPEVLVRETIVGWLLSNSADLNSAEVQRICREEADRVVGDLERDNWGVISLSHLMRLLAG